MVHEATQGRGGVGVAEPSGRWAAVCRPIMRLWHAARQPSSFPASTNQTHNCDQQGGKDLSEPELARALAHESREAAAVSGSMPGCLGERWC